MRTIAGILALLFLSAGNLVAQLDSIHWLPPMHARSEPGPQYLYLSTPETTPFTVYIETGAGVHVDSAVISNANPYKYLIGSSGDTYTLVPEGKLHQAIAGRGLVIRGAKPFFAAFRAHSYTERHADELTCKGQAALGLTFRIGHLEQAPFLQEIRSNFIGVLATEDHTVIVLSGYNPNTRFRVNGTDMLTTTPINITLQKGESAVISNYIYEDILYQPPNGLMGALLESNKPIAVNCGSWLGSPSTFQGHDIGIDQIVPVERVGDEYILCKGNGSSILEHPIIIGHYDGTEVRLNGSAVPNALLDGGESFIVPTSAYTTDGNLYIRTNKPVYVYQMIGGTATSDDQYRTEGLMFVPPISCGIPNTIDNIFQPNSIGNMHFDGGLMIVAMRDSQVVVRVDNNVVNLGPPATVQGNPDFVTYRKLDLFKIGTVVNSVSVKAEGAVQVAMYGRNEPASFAAFFSGFTQLKKPGLVLTNPGDGICPDTLIANGHFDGVEWSLNGAVQTFGPDTFFIAYTPGIYSATGYLGVCRRTDFAKDTIVATFESPKFNYEITEPSCFGYDDGSVLFKDATRGKPPYQYSVDNGIHFDANPIVGGLYAADYQLIIRDSVGCLSPFSPAEIGQPDSFGVKIVAVSLPDPLYPGTEVQLQGQPDRVISAALWAPLRTPDCTNCLDYTIHPLEKTWVELTVFDTAGCPASDRILLEITPFVYAPNVIRPGDPVNGTFRLFSKENVPVRRLVIYDRWGGQVFQKTNFTIEDADGGWDGTVKGKSAAPGVYVFYAEVELLSGRITVISGDLTVLN